MSDDASSESSEIIANHIQNLSDKLEENGSDDIVYKAVSPVSEQKLDISYKKEIISEISESSSSSSPSHSSSSEIDSEDSLDLDEDEIEREKKEYDEKLEEIENEFYLLKEILYKERMKNVEEKIIEVQLGTAKEYCLLVEKAQEQLKIRLESAFALKDFKLESLNHKYAAEKQAINQNFENNKEILYDTIKADLEEQIQRLEEEQSEADVYSLLWLEHSSKHSKRGRRKRPSHHGQEPTKSKPLATSGPIIVHMLKEEEILEDWTKVKKILSASKRKVNVDQQFKPY